MAFLIACTAQHAYALQTGTLPLACIMNTFDEVKPLDIEANSGCVVYMDFRASWCKPCWQSMPFMDDIQQHLNTVQLVRTEDQSYPECHEVQAMPSPFLRHRKGITRHIEFRFKKGGFAELLMRVESVLAE